VNEHFYGGLAIHFYLRSIEDGRGSLMPIEFGNIDFRPRHAFLVTAHDGAIRGGHAHRLGNQLLVCISGEIEIALALDGEKVGVTLDSGANALMVGSPIWSSQTYRGQEPKLLVFSDHPFDPDDYIVDPA
jgi:UDP-2-acetamido-3-amino-2,3-dideoxy-glucuronate N-acetyltransferase